MMRRAIHIAGSVVVLVAACRSPQVETSAGTVMAVADGAGEAVMRSSSGEYLGALRVESTSGGSVRVFGSLNAITPGTHGIHVHAVGRCDAPDFTSAGGHLNPTGAKHGLHNPSGPHAGDAPNITANAQRQAAVDFTLPRAALPSLTAFWDSDGAAIVIHASADDQHTDPAGNSGARIACGVVTARP